jgi:iron(III) transport system permease protein
VLRICALLIALCCIAPLGTVLASWLLPLPESTLEAWAHLRATLLSTYLWETTLLCLGVAIIGGTGGVMTGWFLSQYRFPGSRLLQWGMILPLAMPAYVAAYGYGWLLEYAGPVQSTLREVMGWQRGDYSFPQIRSLGGAMVILGLATTPYSYILARVAFLSQPREWQEAASTLGASAGRFFRRIALPAARPFIATGIALALMETVADIGTVTVLGVNSVSAGIYRSWFFMDEPFVAARLAGMLLIFVCALMALEAFGRRGMRYHSLRDHAVAEIPTIRGFRGWATLALCSIPFLLGFVVPLLILLRLNSYDSSFTFSADLFEYAWQTARLATIAGLLAATAALLMVCAERFHASWLRAVTLIANLGYAIPGMVVAVGLMLLFGWLREYFHSSLILTGSIAGLLIAYSVRFMATAYSPIHSGMLRIAPELDMAAASLGKSRITTIFRIHLPLLVLPVSMAFLLVFVDTVKELPATLILRPFDVKTLGVATYEFASDDRHVEAAPYALSLVAISTLAVLILHFLQQLNQRRRHGND